MPIRLKLVSVFLMVCLIPSLFITVLTFTNYKNSIEANRISELQDIVTFKAGKIEATFATLKNNIEVAQNFWNIKKNLPTLIRLARNTNDPEFIAAKNALDGQLQPMQKVLGLDNIMLLDLEGKVVYSSNVIRAQKELLNSLPDPQQKAFLEGKNKIYLTDIYATKTNKEEPSNMLISAPALDLEGVLIGVIVFDANMMPIYKLIQESTGLGNTGETLIVKKMETGVIYLNPLKHAPDEVLTKTIDLGENIGLPAQEAAGGKGGSGMSIDYRGEKVIAAWRYIPSLAWGVVGKIDTGEAFADVENLKNLTLIILAIVFFLVGMMAFSISKAITDPIYQLTKGVEIIGSGNLGYQIEPKTKDEIGRLSVAFNQMAHKLKDSQDKLLRHEKLAVIGKLASSVAHELRNPLGVMKNVTYYLNMLESVKDNPEITENLAMINQEIGNSDKIIADLLEFSRSKDPVFHPENINPIVMEILNRLSVPPDIELALELRDDLPKIEIDALQMHQVLFNITKNALEAMDKKGKLKIKTGLTEGGFMQISISDTGPGISKENSSKIFEPLFSTKAKGTGLGLSVCLSMVERHNGKIEVDSEAGKGTTFIIRLPIKQE